MRYLGIDFGERRMGLAISDDAGRVATPLTTIVRSSDAQAIGEINAVIESEEVQHLVVGEPLRLDGSRGPAAERVASFCRKLGEATGLPITLVDEALTTHEAAARLAETPRSSRQLLDAVAAQIILQEALDKRLAGDDPDRDDPPADGPAGDAPSHGDLPGDDQADDDPAHDRSEPRSSGLEGSRGSALKRALGWSLGFVGLLIVGLAIVGWTAWRSLSEPYQAYPGDAVELNIEPGLSARQILDRLAESGVIQETFWARLYLSRYLDDPTLKAGEYRFSGPATTPEALEKITRGEVLTHDVTVIEGLDLRQIASHLAAAGFGAEDEFMRLMSSPEMIADLDPVATDLEGYVFPDTYAFARNIGEREIVTTMVDTFRRQWAETIAPLLPEGDETTAREVVTLASIVESETGVDEERATVAGVYANRLRIGMGLYADPTVIYALKRQSTWDGNLRRPDLEIDSPYNTYRYPGLPPGPICSPGLASLKAAAQPADVPYLYFVSRNDGTHVFARTLAEHNRNVERWQKQYWRERWARERAQQPGSD